MARVTKANNTKLSASQKAAIVYHDQFSYPLSSTELFKWSYNEKLPKARKINMSSAGGFHFVQGRSGLIRIRRLRLRESQRKLKIAKRAAEYLSKIPSVLMVGITGSLAMMNADKRSDIDFMVVTRKNTLWTTRLLALSLLKRKRVLVRRYGERSEKDKICLNLWLDETALVWRKRNAFTAHEIAQVVPLANKSSAYEKFVNKNQWIKRYWPSAVEHSEKQVAHSESFPGFLCSMYHVLCTIIEPLAFGLQLIYMKPKMTREVVTKNRAIFHPVDLSNSVAPNP